MGFGAFLVSGKDLFCYKGSVKALYGLLGFSLGVYRVHDIVLLATMMMIFIATSVRTFITATSSTITAAITSITASYEFYHY